MITMMISNKSPEEISQIMSEIMPEMMNKLGPHGMARIMNDMIPDMMDACFAGMNMEQRRSMLKQYRSMLDSMEEKYLA
jgi:hypothetical protein